MNVDGQQISWLCMVSLSEIVHEFCLYECKNTIYGADSHQGETPGLGAEISKPAFSNEFKGKKIFMSGEFKSVAVVKPGKSVAGQDYVDGISGGTITSKGVDEMLFNSLSGYVKFLTSQN